MVIQFSSYTARFRISGFLFVAVLWLFQSCNIVAMVDRKQRKKFERNQIHSETFRTTGKEHHLFHTQNGKEPVVLLHGYGASGIGQYFKTALALKDDYEIILPDLLHNGMSKSTNDDYSISAQVDHLALMLDSIQVTSPVTLIGNSYGGIVAAYFAEKYPDRVKQLVIYDSPINFYTLAYADSLSKSLDVPSIYNILSPTNIHENKVSLGLVFHNQPYIPRFLRHQMVKYGSIPVRDEQTKLIDYLLAREQEFNDHFFQWKMPVYVIWGDHDVLIPMSTARAIVKRYNIPEGQFRIFRNAAHAVNVEHADEFIAFIREIMAN
jgi:abhydrolase domain-containing protein 6